jgi:hypothetical protein
MVSPFVLFSLFYSIVKGASRRTEEGFTNKETSNEERTTILNN